MWIGTALERTGYGTAAGVYITPDTALKISSVYACVTILAETIASLPMMVCKRLPTGGNKPADAHPLYSVLHDQFNAQQTSFEAREMGIGHLKLRGNWYSRKEVDGSGRIVGLCPMNPTYMQVQRVNGEVWYDYQCGGNEDELGNPRRTYSASEIWHVKGFTTTGLTGLSTISNARESMGLAKGLADFQGEFFGRKAVPGAIIESPKALGPKGRANLRDGIQEYASSRRHTALVLEEGMKWNNVGISNKDAQFLELSNASVRDIARWFKVPLILLQEPDKVSTYASAEQFMLSFVVHTISPIVARIEQSANVALLTESERRRGYYVKINVNGLLRGDFKTRMDGYRIGREGGWLCADDVRALEDMTPLPEDKGQIFIQPMNFIEAGTQPVEPAGSEPDNGEQE
jgi:HK97 family phage portal protein